MSSTDDRRAGRTFRGNTSLALESALGHFEEAWHRGQRPAIEDYLPQERGDFRALLVELACTDLEYRIKLGERARVEEYLARFPGLTGDTQAVVELATLEFDMRRRREAGVSPADYLCRFPQGGQDLASRLAAVAAREPSSPRPVATACPTAATNLGQLRDYVLLEKLGEGGMGAVYKALHTRLGKTVAIKVLPDHLEQNSHASERFQREMLAAGQLEHRHLVRATDAGEADGRLYLVMEYLDGLDLAKVVDRAGTLAVADACEVVRQAASGLQHAHRNGLVHRDIKPSNLMLTAAGKIKVLDLGLALARIRGAKGDLTFSGDMMGSLDYMSPEQAENSHHVDIRADIYSLGCTLYKLLAGRAPFEDPRYAHMSAKIGAHETLAPPPIGERRPDVPAALVEIMDRMLAKDPAARFATPADVAAALVPFCGASRPAAVLAAARAVPARQESTSQASLRTQVYLPEQSTNAPQARERIEGQTTVDDPGSKDEGEASPAPTPTHRPWWRFWG